MAHSLFSLSRTPDQKQALDTFCKGACGPAFDTAVAGWRSWCVLCFCVFVCRVQGVPPPFLHTHPSHTTHPTHTPRCDSDRASFEPIPADDGKPPAFSFEGFVAEFGCAKAASGNYCARLVVDNLQAAATDTTAKCGYYASCCAGELSRVVRLADAEDRAAKREAQCPGARAALTQKCAA